MYDQLIDVIGNWIENFGATVGAIGESNVLIGREEIGSILVIIGNTNQSIGTTLQAIAESEDVLAELGNWLQTGGTATIAAAEYEIFFNGLDEEIGVYDKIYGDVTQSAGAFFTAVGRLDNNPKRVIGNVIQSIGAALGAIGGFYTVKGKEKEGQLLQVIGSWFQSVGTAYQAIGATREYLYGETDFAGQKEEEVYMGRQPSIFDI